MLKIIRSSSKLFIQSNQKFKCSFNTFNNLLNFLKKQRYENIVDLAEN